jgi:hypothetical protein
MATIRRRPGPLAALLAAEVVSTTGSMVVLAIPGGAVAGRLGEALPLWLLAAPLPAPAAVAVLGLAGLATGSGSRPCGP